MGNIGHCGDLLYLPLEFGDFQLRDIDTVLPAALGAGRHCPSGSSCLVI